MKPALLTFDVDAEAPLLAASKEHRKNAMAMTHQAFGPRVGVPRILELLAEFELPATFFVPGVTAMRHPAAVEAILAAGHEIGHHSHMHVSALDLTPEDERRDFELALEALARFGVRPRGHRAAMWEATWRTVDLVAEYGLIYDSSLMESDRPYVARTNHGEIAELPPHWSLDDWEQYAFLPRPDIGQSINHPADVAKMWIHELDSARRHGTLFLLTCHPFLTGRAGRLEALRSVVEAAVQRGDVKFVGCAELADEILANPLIPRRDVEPPDEL